MVEIINDRMTENKGRAKDLTNKIIKILWDLQKLETKIIFNFLQIMHKCSEHIVYYFKPKKLYLLDKNIKMNKI